MIRFQKPKITLNLNFTFIKHSYNKAEMISELVQAHRALRVFLSTLLYILSSQLFMQ